MRSARYARDHRISGIAKALRGTLLSCAWRVFFRTGIVACARPAIPTAMQFRQFEPIARRCLRKRVSSRTHRLSGIRRHGAGVAPAVIPPISSTGAGAVGFERIRLPSPDTKVAGAVCSGGRVRTGNTLRLGRIGRRGIGALVALGARRNARRVAFNALSAVRLKGFKTQGANLFKVSLLV